MIIVGYLIALLLLAPINQDHAKGWHGLVPLLATRRDVEGLLGTPQTPGGSSYQTDEGNVYVYYSDGPCEKGWPYGWNVQKDTVVSITVVPKETVYTESLKLDLSKYVRTHYGHLSDVFRYANNDEGFVIEIDEFRRTVRMFIYVPASSDSKLQCPDAANQLPVGRIEADPFFRFDVYGDAPLKHQQERLDAVAAAMIRSPETEAYIIAYAGLVAQSGEAEVRATCARNYLIKKHRINAERIHAIDGGYREERTVEIYVEQKDGDVPLAAPSVRPSKVKITEKSPTDCLLLKEIEHK